MPRSSGPYLVFRPQRGGVIHEPLRLGAFGAWSVIGQYVRTTRQLTPGGFLGAPGEWSVEDDPRPNTSHDSEKAAA